MKKAKKNATLTLCAGALSLLFTAGVAVVGANADVTEDNGKVSISSFTMVQSASAYIGDVDDTTATGGLRFDATLTKDDYDALKDSYNAVKFGMLVTPTDCITTDVATDLFIGSTTLPEYDENATYTADSKFYYNKEIAPAYDTTDYPELYTFRCALTNIKEENFSRPYTARAYIATQKQANGAWEYTYAGSFERAIYSVATYAMNDNVTFSSDPAEQQAVESYLNSIIDKVQQYYDITVTQTVNGEIATGAKLGDTITLKGVATKKSDTSKTLDMCPTIEVAENSALTAVENTQGRKYQVTGLGNATYTWSSGVSGATNTENGTGAINGQTKLDILTSETQLSNVVMREGDKSTAQVVYKDTWSDGSYKYQFDKGIFAWSLKDGVEAKTHQTYLQNGFSFTNEIKQYIKAGTYLYFDIVVPNETTAGGATSGAPDGNLLITYTNDTINNYYFSGKATADNGSSQAYTMDGTKASGDWNWGKKYTNIWMRVRFNVPYDWANNANAMFTVNTNSYPFDNIVYLSNIFVSSENLENTSGNLSAIEYTKTMLPYKSSEFLATNALTAVSTTSITAVTDTDGVTEPYDGREGVINWVTTTGDVASNRIWFSSELVTAWKKYGYLTFDIYNASDEGTTLMVNLRGTFNGATTDGSQTQIKSSTVTTTGDSVIRVFKKQETGGYANGGNDATTGLVKGTWYTVEVWVNNPTDMLIGEWCNYLALGAKRDTYIDNIHVSNYSWIDEVNDTYLATGASVTQESVVDSNDYSSLAKYADFTGNAEAKYLVPALKQGVIPQGIDVWEEENLLLISGYLKTNETLFSSMIVAVDLTTGELAGTYFLKNVNGTYYTGHAGGIAVTGKNIFIANSSKLYRIPLSQIETTGAQGTLNFVEEIKVPVKASFCNYANGVLWVGEFYHAEVAEYATPEWRHLTNDKGTKYCAWTVGYTLENTEREIALSAWDASTMSYATPNYVLAITDRIQGITLVGDKIVLSQSYSRTPDSKLFVYDNVLNNTQDTSVTLNGEQISVWFLDEDVLTKTYTTMPMSEGVANCNGKILVLFESGAPYFSDGVVNPTDRVWSLTLTD